MYTILSSYSISMRLYSYPKVTDYPRTEEKVNSSILSFGMAGSNGAGERGKHDAPGKRASTTCPDELFIIFSISERTHPRDQTSTSKL